MDRSSRNGKEDKLNISESLERFEENFRKQTEEMRRARREYYSSKGERRRGVNIADDASIYKARAALKDIGKTRMRGEGAVMRTVRLFKEMRAAVKRYSDHAVYPQEKRFRAYSDILCDCYAPVFNGYNKLLNTLWDFVTTFARDFWDALLYVGDLLITGWYYLGSVLLFIWDVIWDVRYWFDTKKGLLFQVFAALLATASVAAVIISSMTFYEYYYHGKLLGVVRNKEDVYKTIEALGDKLSEASGANVSLDIERDIDFEMVRGANYVASSNEDILNTLTYMKDIDVTAYAIYVDGVQRVIIENEEMAENILKAIENDYTPALANIEYDSVDIDQEISIQEVSAQLGDIWNATDAKRYLKTGSKSIEADLETMPIVSVTTVARETYTEDVDYSTKYVKNNSMYLDEQEVISEGIKGVNKVEAQIVLKNGQESTRQVIATTMIAEPIDEVIYQGTKALPVRAGTGTFIYPVSNYTLSSRFGARWGRMHYGIDLAAPYGTKIYAADGGTVTFVGYNNARGNYLIIDHGGLFQTLYEHCASILVEEGEQV
ncbi:MAG: G5 domain-containing protein, partial [Firmicutes bacterium]|nr:G5 domain-containing protein [Bacillota bacterium]